MITVTVKKHARAPVARVFAIATDFQNAPGHIRGITNTMPLHVEILYNEYQGAAAFAVASLLALLAVATLAAKTLLEWRMSRRARGGHA